MDASKSDNFQILGQFWLLPVIAKMDALKVNIIKIPTILDERGYKSGQGHQIDRRTVVGITHKYKLKTRYARLRATGKLTVNEVASLLGVTVATVRSWGKKGMIKTYPYNDRNGCLYEHPGVNSPLMKKRA